MGRGVVGVKNGINVGTATHVGVRRSVNEDAYCALVGSETPSGTEALLAIADGMGGHQAGEVASSMAIHGLVDGLCSVARRDGIGGRQISVEQLMASVFEDLDRDIRSNVRMPGRLGMGTTLTAALAVDGSLFVAHVGDTRAYLLRDGELCQLTRDHSWVAEQVARGVLTPAAAKSHSKRHVITRALGTGPDCRPDTRVVPIEKGDVVLICSDGLHSQVPEDSIREDLVAMSPELASQSLVERANSAGGSDNVTVVVASMGSSPG